MKKIAITIENVVIWLGKIAYALVLVEIIFVLYSIFMRYVLGNPMRASVEFDQILIVLIVCLGSAYTLQVEGHIYVEFLLDRVKSKWKYFIIGANSLISVVFVGILLYFSYFLVNSSFKIHELTQGMGILLWPVKSILLLGFTLLGLQFLVLGIKNIYLCLTVSS